VTAVVTHDGTCTGAVGPFPVDVPWWADVEPVVAHLEQVLGGPAVVLRLLSVEGSDGMRDGHVTYHAEALGSPPGDLAPCDFADDDHPLRLPWARAAGLRDLLGWAAGHVELTGRPMQRKTWNLSCLFRLPAASGPVWLKAIPPFAAAEPAALAAFAEVDPGLVPAVLASGPGRLLLADVPGTERRDQSPQVIADTVRRFVAAQARVSPPGGLPDRRPEVLAAAVRDLLDGPVGDELTPAELRAVRSLQDRWEMLASCGLPDTVVHGDFHPVNWRSDGGVAVVLDFADAHLGNPVLDGLRAIDFLTPALRGAAAAAWTEAWTAAAPRSRPAEALRIAEPLAHFAYAVRYQEFLDNIEPSERVYHHGDPAAAIRAALARS
jgi:Phosphotransferase enzyme family